MRKFTLLVISTLYLACLGGITARAQSSGKFFNAVTNLNPIGYWPLSENVQPPATPPVTSNLGSLGATGNGQYLGGVFPGVTGALAGSADTAAGFDRSSGRVLIFLRRKRSIFPRTTQVWVNQAVTNAITESVMSMGSFGSPSGAPADGFYGWAVYVRGNQYNLRLYNTNSTNPSLSISATNFVLPNVWTHVAVTYDGTTASLYLNGVLATNGVPTANLSGLKYVDDDGTSNTLFSVGGKQQTDDAG